MLNKIKNISKIQIFILLLIIVLVLFLIVFVSSRAFINPEVTTDSFSTIDVSTCGYFKYEEESNSINLTNSFPMSDNKGMLLDPYTFSVSNSCEEDNAFNVYFVVSTDTEIQPNEIKVNISSEETAYLVDLPSVDLTQDIIDQYRTLTNNEIHSVYLLTSAMLGKDTEALYNFRMWLDYDAGNSEKERLFEGNIIVADTDSSENVYHVSPLARPCNGENISECFVENYELENNLIKHDDTIATGAEDNNIRYSNVNPSNYVCFGSDEIVCPEDDLYRVMGMYNIDGEYKLRLVKAFPIDKNEDGAYDVLIGETDTFIFDSGSDNRWEGASTSITTDDAEINIYLNDTYYNSLSTKYKDMISTEKLNIGAIPNDDNNKAKNFYEYETSLQSVNEYNISLLTPSDYMFGASQDYWSYYNYNPSYSTKYQNNSVVYNTNWLHLNNSGDFGSFHEYSITEHATIDSYVHVIYSLGYPGFNYTYYSRAIRPVIYLNTNLYLSGGQGTSINPFRLS